MEEKKKSNRELTLAIIGVLISLAAFIVAAQSNCQSQKAFEWTVEEAKKQQLTDVQIKAFLKFERVYMSNFTEISLPIKNRDTSYRKNAWHGLYLYATVNIYNNSKHSVSIDNIEIIQQLYHMWRPNLFSNELVKNDYKSIQQTPIYLDVHEAIDVNVKIPWLIEESLALPFSQLEKGVLYTPKEMLSLYYKIIYPTVIVPFHEDETGSAALINLLDNQVTEKSFLDDDPFRKLLAKVKLSNDSLITTKIYYKF